MSLSLPDSEFLTVSQAAARLGISERQARRYAAKLAPDDRREGGHEAGHMTGSRPTQVRLAAMQAKRGTVARSNEPLQAVERPDTEADTTPDTRPAQAGHEAGHMTAALVAQLQGENGFLRGQIEQHARAEAELRAALREALKMSNRALMPAGDEGAPQAQQSAENVPTGNPARPGPSGQRRPRWLRLLGIR